jgi:dTDP-4-dehydrorhamnose reductase
VAGRRRILIVGGDSTIGRALALAHRKNGDEVFATSRRTALDKDVWPLDLAHVTSAWRPPASVDAAYICGAVTSLKACANDPAGTARVNVRGTLAVSEALITKGVFLSVLSSNLVFDGTRPHVPCDAQPSPRCEYGLQKTKVEYILGKTGAPVAIVRLTKVVAPDHQLFTGWMEDLSQGNPISPFWDMVIAPLSLSFVCQTLLRITDLRRIGVSQVSPSHDITYADAAKHLASKLGADPSLVRPVSARSSCSSIFQPAYTSLAATEPITQSSTFPSPLDALNLLVAHFIHSRTKH